MQAVTISYVLPCVLALYQNLSTGDPTYLTAMTCELKSSLRTRFEGIFLRVEGLAANEPDKVCVSKELEFASVYLRQQRLLCMSVNIPYMHINASASSPVTRSYPSHLLDLHVFVLYRVVSTYLNQIPFWNDVYFISTTLDPKWSILWTEVYVEEQRRAPLRNEIRGRSTL